MTVLSLTWESPYLQRLSLYWDGARKYIPGLYRQFAFVVFRFGLVKVKFTHMFQGCFTGTRLCFYQTRSAWSMDQGSNENHSPINSSTPTVTKFCVMWEGQALPHDTKFGNCRDNIEDSRVLLSWSLIQGSSWSGLIKVPNDCQRCNPGKYSAVLL